MTQPGGVVEAKAADATTADRSAQRESAAGSGSFDRRSSTGTVQMDDPGQSAWQTKPPSPEELVPTGMMWVLAAVFAAVVVLAMDILLSIWPSSAATGAAADAAATVAVLWGRVPMNVTMNDRMMLIAILMGVIGAMVHAMTSFADFVGNRRLAKSWLPWYFLRPLIGSGLSLFFYVGFRAGLLTTSAADGGVVNPFGIAAIGGLAGMFSKQATDKLNEIFTTMFKTSAASGDDRRGGKLDPKSANRPIADVTEGGKV